MRDDHHDTDPHPDPEHARLRALAQQGTEELAELSRSRADQIWANVRDEALADDRASTTTTPWTSRWAPLALAAAIALVVGVAVGAGLDGPGDEAGATLATVQLAPLTDDVPPHTAELREDAEGRTVVVELDDLPSTDGFHEVWLLDPTTGALVSLGPVRADDTYAVPDGVDLVDLSVLDVSVEPHDGDPGHSGASVLRGEVRLTG